MPGDIRDASRRDGLRGTLRAVGLALAVCAVGLLLSALLTWIV
ncbi:MAG: hypothetical protein WDZ26_01205 [Nitriliruptoraceae bacterium]